MLHMAYQKVHLKEQPFQIHACTKLKNNNNKKKKTSGIRRNVKEAFYSSKH